MKIYETWKRFTKQDEGSASFIKFNSGLLFYRWTDDEIDQLLFSHLWYSLRSNQSPVITATRAMSTQTDVDVQVIKTQTDIIQASQQKLSRTMTGSKITSLSRNVIINWKNLENPQTFDTMTGDMIDILWNYGTTVQSRVWSELPIDTNTCHAVPHVNHYLLKHTPVNFSVQCPRNSQLWNVRKY